MARRLDRERTEQTGSDELPKLSVRILDLFVTRERLTARDIQTLTGANPNTLKLYL